jgi:hypothetical protein
VSRRPIRVLHFFENSAPPGSRSSGHRSCRCQSSVLLSRLGEAQPDALATLERRRGQRPPQARQDRPQRRRRIAGSLVRPQHVDQLRPVRSALRAREQEAEHRGRLAAGRDQFLTVDLDGQAPAQAHPRPRCRFRPEELPRAARGTSRIERERSGVAERVPIAVGPADRIGDEDLAGFGGRAQARGERRCIRLARGRDAHPGAGL